MKKLTTLFVLTLLLFSLQAGFVSAAENPSMSVTIASYTPIPARPGSYVTVSLKLANNGNGDAKSAAIEFVDNYPFSVDNEADRKQDAGTIGAQEDYLAEYRVRIDSAALEGANYLKVRYTADANKGQWLEKEIPITVSSAQKTVSINTVQLTPEQVAPGKKADLSLKIKNFATADLRDIGIKLDLTGMVVGTTFVDIPLAPVGSSIEKRISLLKAGETADFTFILQAYPEAEAGIYKIPVTLTYTDDTGQEFERIDLISIPINGETDVMVHVDETSLHAAGTKGDVSITVTNKGFSELKFLTVELGDSDEYSITSTTNKIYVGNVDSDDYETAEFSLSLAATEGMTEVTLPVTLKFKDALNNDHSIEESLVLPLIPSNGEKKNSTGIIVVIVVVIIVALLFIRRRNKHHKKRH